jgi:hypothetical protein
VRGPLVTILSLLMCVSFCVTNAEDTSPQSTRERRYRAFQEKRSDLLGSFQQQLKDLKQRFTDLGWSGGLSEIEESAGSVGQNHADLNSELPRLARRIPDEDQVAVTDEEKWRVQIWRVRSQSAMKMYQTARDAVRAGFPSLGFAMVGDAARMDPDHKGVRSVLGYELFQDPSRKDDATYAGEWASPFEATMRGGAKPQIYDPRFGWIPASSLSRYEQGLRPWKSAWISVEKESELRRDFKNAWEVRSEHFLVKTNVSLEAGVKLGRNLETFYAWLLQNMPGVFDSPRALRERFDNASRRSSPREQKPMLVNYYATREEYQRQLRDKIPPNTETNGLYWDRPRQQAASYFFVQENGDDQSTLFHEATHQILDTLTYGDRRKAAEEKKRQLRQRSLTEWGLCENSNFWLVEGLACYFESFEIVDGEIRVGRPDFVRFDAARIRLLDGDKFFYVPLRQFFAFGKEEFQSHSNAKQFYTQASGVVHFLMHYQDGIYRDDFVTLLQAVYRPNLNDVLTEPSFEQILGVSFEELDKQYRLHMQSLDDQIHSATLDAQ